jgi:hypothetical protein
MLITNFPGLRFVSNRRCSHFNKSTFTNHAVIFVISNLDDIGARGQIANVALPTG